MKSGRKAGIEWIIIPFIGWLMLCIAHDASGQVPAIDCTSKLGCTFITDPAPLGAGATCNLKVCGQGSTSGTCVNPTGKTTITAVEAGTGLWFCSFSYQVFQPGIYYIISTTASSGGTESPQSNILVFESIGAPAAPVLKIASPPVARKK
jgi:hypothetical protein